MPGPKKRLGKGSQRLKFKDISPRAEAGDQVHVGRKKDGEGVNLKYGGKVEGYYRGGDVRTDPKRGQCY